MKNQNNIKVQAFSMNIENLLLVVQNNKKDGNSTSVRYLTEECHNILLMLKRQLRYLLLRGTI